MKDSLEIWHAMLERDMESLAREIKREDAEPSLALLQILIGMSLHLKLGQHMVSELLDDATEERVTKSLRDEDRHKLVKAESEPPLPPLSLTTGGPASQMLTKTTKTSHFKAPSTFVAGESRWWEDKNRYTIFVKYVRRMIGADETVSLRKLLSRLGKTLQRQPKKLPPDWDTEGSRQKTFAAALVSLLGCSPRFLGVKETENLSRLLISLETAWLAAGMTIAKKKRA